MMKRVLGSIIVLMVLVGGAMAETEIVELTTIEDLIDQWGGGLYWMNADQSIFCGGYYFGGGFRWTPDEGTEHIGGYLLRGMDNNGVVVGETNFPMIMDDGTLDDVEAAAYYDQDEWTMIGPIEDTVPFDPYHYQGAWAVAADTFIIAGMYWHDNYRTTAFVWDPTNPAGTLLPDYGLEWSSRPNAMNADGSVIVGWASMDYDGQYNDRVAHRWHLNDTTGSYDLEFLGHLGPEPYVGGEAYGVSTSGEVITGWSYGEMFIWTEETGMVNHGMHESYDPGTGGMTPLDINENQQAVGFGQPQTWVWTREAFMYTPESGIIFIKDSLENLDLEDEFENFAFLQANAISEDGNTIIGTGAGLDGILTPYILKFNPPQKPQQFYSVILDDVDGARIELFWDGTVEYYAYEYELERRVTESGVSSDWTNIASIDSSESSYVDTDIYLEYEVEWEYRIRSLSPLGESEWVEIETFSNLAGESQRPGEFRITSAYPNPFNPSTTVSYDIPRQMDVEITLYSITGSEIGILEQGNRAAGSYELHLDMSEYAAGVYLVQIRSEGFEAVKKLTLIK